MSDEATNGQVTDDAPQGSQEPEPTEQQKGEALTAFEQRLHDAKEQVSATALHWAETEAANKQAKKDFKSAVDTLEGIVQRGPENYPLFDKAGGNATEAAADESWREVEISELEGLTSGLCSKLYEAGIDTIGKLADYTKDGQAQITDIDGIGPAAAEKIEGAMTAFWASRPSPVSESDTVATEEAPAEELEPVEA